MTDEKKPKDVEKTPVLKERIKAEMVIKLPIEDDYIQLLKEWVKWNRKKITGDDFAHKFGGHFKKDCKEAWENDQRKK